MRKIIIFLLLIVFTFCHIDEAKREELRQRRKEEMKLQAECLLKNPNTSEELKKAIRESPEDDIKRALHPHDHKLEESDKNIIRECRREAHRTMHEERRRAEHKKMHEKKPHPGDL